MSKDSRAIVARWKVRLAIRKRLLDYAQRQYSYWYRRWRDAVKWNLSTEERSRRWHLKEARRHKRDLRQEQVEYAQRVIDRHSRPAYTVVKNVGPYRSGGAPLGAIEWVTIHHDAGTRPQSMEDTAARLNGYDRHHMNMWGTGIGYHEAIDIDGRVWLLRSHLSRGAHTGGHNTGNYGIMLLGNFEQQTPTVAQLDTLRARISAAPVDGLPDLRGKNVRGHKDWPGPTNATACPGRGLYPHVQKLPGYRS